jgi:hypothetical protein
LKHLSEKQAILSTATRRHRQLQQQLIDAAHSGQETAPLLRELAGTIEEIADARKREDLYECLICHKEFLAGAGDLVLGCHTVKTLVEWRSCDACETRQADDASECAACSGPLTERLQSHWLHECECKSKPDQVTARFLVICAKCATKIRILDYINKR